MRRLQQLTVVGADTLENGRESYGRLLSNFWKIPGVSCNDISNPETLDRVVQEIHLSTAGIYVVALRIDGHTTDIGQQIYRAILEKGAIAVCINSIQEEVNHVLSTIVSEVGSGAVLCVHPNYGPKNLIDRKPGSNIVTGVYGEERAKKGVERFLKMAIPKDSKDFSWIDLRDESLDIDGKRFRGAKLHDFVLAYTQSLVHMLRIVLNPEDFVSIFPDVQVSTKFSRSLITGNPYAQRLYQEKFLGSMMALSDAMTVAKLMVQEIKELVGERAFFEHLQTPNFHKLLLELKV